MQWERDTVLDEVLLKNGFMLDYTLTKRPEFTRTRSFSPKTPTRKACSAWTKTWTLL